MSFNRRDIEFLYEVGSMRHVQRAWRQHLGVNCSTVLEHTLRVVWLSLILGRREKIKDEEKLMKMALVHDLAETRTADMSYVQKIYVEADEDRAARDAIAGTSLPDFYTDILHEYEARKSKISRIVKDADNLDVDLEIRELAEQGAQLPKKWKKFRRLVRDKKLYTKSAKDFWDALDKVDVADWHMVANKWVKQPNAGK